VSGPGSSTINVAARVNVMSAVSMTRSCHSVWLLL
jgi:hypothetical protein